MRKRLVEIQYLRTTITDEQRREFSDLVHSTIRQIESAEFLPHSGIRFPQNPCSSCPYIGLCLGKQPLVDPGSFAGQEARTLVCLTSLRTKYPRIPPKLNPKRALFVLTKIDEIPVIEQAIETAH